MTGIRAKQRKKQTIASSINTLLVVLVVVFFGMNIVNNTRIVKLQEALNANEVVMIDLLDQLNQDKFIELE